MQELEAGTTFGGYTIEGLVAGGGMGSVYAARHTVYGSSVALKILHADLHADASWRERFNKEGLVGTQLKHPHVLAARELIMEDDGRVALVLDLVSGGLTLLRVMSREFPDGLPLVQALQVLLGIIQGVEYAHDKGVIHGDIKPENVLIQGEFRDPRTWVPKLTDFGTVGILALPVMIDGHPAVVVSPRYASPEHIRGMDHLEPRSDVYCLGLLLHYLLTGQHASNAGSVAEAADTVVKPVPIGAVIDQPDSIIKVFQKATRVNRTERFRSCREFAVAIRTALDALGAELDLDDLQADLATEIIEERRKAKLEMVRAQHRSGQADAMDEPTGGWLGIDPETGSVTSALAPSAAEEEDPDLAATDRPSPNREVAPEDATVQPADDRAVLVSQTPPGAAQYTPPYDPDKVATEIPADRRAAERAPLPTYALAAGAVLLVLVIAIVWANWPTM